MGCSSGKPNTKAGIPGNGDSCLESEISLTWATRKEAAVGTGAKQATASESPGGARAPNARGSPGLHAKGRENQASSGKPTLVDADDESEIEIICEAKATKQQQRAQDLDADQGDAQRPLAANAQEAPEQDESDVLLEEARPSPEQEVLSARQKDEAAKLAEQRKRFDNQRYRREVEAGKGVGAGAGRTSPPLGGAHAGAKLVAHKPKQEAPRHDLVMGLNLAGSYSQAETTSFEDCLPGGIFNELPLPTKHPPASVVDKNRNRHHLFDEDDEVFMQEILESVDA